MNSKLLMLTVMIIGFSSLTLFFTVYDGYLDEPVAAEVDSRQDLIEVLNASTICTRFWHAELAEMKDDLEHDYKNDPIFIECFEALKLQNMLGDKSK
ncbi:MAG: hypothetical protein GKS07_08415 [Nitrosopumilus sp.]|nr:MAG: hypothetical protein GKS07_08415 [Nitrosopumilus sp.]